MSLVCIFNKFPALLIEDYPKTNYIFTENEKFDCVVIGAGPAGASAGGYLAKNGFKTLILEKRNFPREKICGDGLTPMAIESLVEFGINPRDQKESSWLENQGLQVFGAKKTIEIKWSSLQTKYNGWTCKRDELDSLCVSNAQKLGCYFADDFKVEEIENINSQGEFSVIKANNQKTNDRVNVKAKIVLIAVGANNSNLTNFFGVKKHITTGIACRAYYEYNNPKLTSLENNENNYLQCHLSNSKNNSLGGYKWIFPMQNNIANVGMGIAWNGKTINKKLYALPNKRIKYITNQLNNSLTNFGTNNQYLGNQLTVIKKASLPIGIIRKNLTYKNIICLGDSAGLVSPFNGEGVGYAIDSGKFAQQAVSDYFNNKKPINLYEQRLLKENKGYFNLGKPFISIINNRHLMHLCVNYGLRIPPVVEFTNKLLNGIYDPKNGNYIDKIIFIAQKIAQVF